VNIPAKAMAELDQSLRAQQAAISRRKRSTS
jgi:hypothetical protein